MATEPKQTIAQIIKQRAAAGLGPVVMTRIQISSNVAGVGYDRLNKILYIEFLHGYRPRRGRMQKKKLRPNEVLVYKYFNVPPGIYTQMIHSPSKGKFVWRRIRGKFRYMRLGRKGWRGPTAVSRLASKQKSVSKKKR